MQQFQIEVRPRSTDTRTSVTYYQVVADTEPAAIDEARRRFGEHNPDRSVEECEFRAVRVQYSRGRT